MISVRGELLILFSSYVYYSELMVLQRKALYQGELIFFDGVNITLYDDVTGGNLIYSENFVNKTQNNY